MPSGSQGATADSSMIGVSVDWGTMSSQNVGLRAAAATAISAAVAATAAFVSTVVSGSE